MPLLPVTDERIMLKHGAGGRAMHRLIHDAVLGAFREDVETPGVIGLTALDDGAAIRIGDRWLILTTDSHVIQPPFFPGGDIGRLAISGTVNDLAMMGATEVLGLTCSVIIEEGFPRRDFERILASMRAACVEAGATVVSGDTKVMVQPPMMHRQAPFRDGRRCQHSRRGSSQEASSQHPFPPRCRPMRRQSSLALACPIQNAPRQT